jgi:AraC family cel operon transcriptional repressor
MKLSWEQKHGGFFNAVRSRLTHFPRHCHNFAETFWIEEGQGEHWINGQRRALHPGSLVRIRPEDEHGFRASPPGFVLCNVSFPRSVLRHFQKHSFPENAGFWSGTSSQPIHSELSAAQLTSLQMGFEDLSRGPQNGRTIERFLLNLLYLLEPAPRGKTGSPLPDWLQYACREIREPRHFLGGTNAFARLAGRCPEHVARELRRRTGQTPTDLVNDARLRHAASELLTTDKTVLTVALDCGFASLGHFYQCFLKMWGCTPRTYRLRHPLNLR